MMLNSGRRVFHFSAEFRCFFHLKVRSVRSCKSVRPQNALCGVEGKLDVTWVRLNPMCAASVNSE